MTTRVGEGPEEVVMTSSQQTNANAITNKTSAERGTCHPVCRIETCHPTCNKPCSRTEGDKQQQHHHHHQQQQQEYSSSSSPQKALFRATLFSSGQHSIFSLFFPYFINPGCINLSYSSYVLLVLCLSLCVWLYVLYMFD